jgi:hypothetical protein
MVALRLAFSTSLDECDVAAELANRPLCGRDRGLRVGDFHVHVAEVADVLVIARSGGGRARRRGRQRGHEGERQEQDDRKDAAHRDLHERGTHDLRQRCSERCGGVGTP